LAGLAMAREIPDHHKATIIARIKTPLLRVILALKKQGG